MKKLSFILFFTVVIFFSVSAQTKKTNLKSYYKQMYKNEEQLTHSIRKLVNKLEEEKNLDVENNQIISVKVLIRFYKERNYRPAWNEFKVFEEASEVFKDSYDDGLIPSDYHVDGLLRLVDKIEASENKNQLDTEWVAGFDILMTDAIILYSYHLYVGKVDPHNLDANWNFGHAELKGDGPELLSNAIEKNDVSKELLKLRPELEGYSLFIKTLKEYRQIEEKGGWGTIKLGGKIDPGDSDPRIPQIRKRLAITNDLTNITDMESNTYNPELASDIILFQDMHGLDTDGIIGKGTFHALNIPVEEKIQKIRVNMERARWIMHNLTEGYLLVNIARYDAFVYQKGKLKHSFNVMVGKTIHQTPVFKSKMKYLEFNPTWTVPTSITRNELVPKMKKDPEYLQKNNMVLLDGSGNIISASSIDFSTVSAKRFPYTVRQEPGPKNALGQVKFIFPNKYAVYLHDTQSKSLFSKSKRSFSHGCIRVQGPLDLAEVLLEDSNVNRKQIDKIIASKETKRIFLTEPLDVLLLYWTCGIWDEDKLFFIPDIYERDQKILNKLNSKPSFIPVENK